MLNIFVEVNLWVKSKQKIDNGGQARVVKKDKYKKQKRHQNN